MNTDQNPSPNAETRPSSLRGLLLLNAALLAVLGFVTLGPGAEAQSGRASGEYTMVAGGVNGTEGDVVYIVDTVNEELIAVGYDNNSKRLSGIGYRNVSSDAAQRLVPGRSR